MEGDMHKAAMAHYAHLSMDEKQKVLRSFEQKDANGDRQVTLGEFRTFFPSNKDSGRISASLIDLFKHLDKNDDGTLDFEEFVTCSYVLFNSKYRFCYACGSIVWGIYFVCVECYMLATKENSYDLCCSCYHKKNFSHVHSYFLDTNALLLKIQCELLSEGWPRKREMEGICEAAKAHYAALSESEKLEMRKRFTTMDSDGDWKVSRRDYSDYISKAGFSKDLFDDLDKNGDGMLDFDEYKAFDFIYVTRGYTFCGGCSEVLLGIHFICVKCYDAGENYHLCCKCYGEKSYKHADGHTYFTDTHSLIQIRKGKPKPVSPTQDILTQEKMEEMHEVAMVYYAKMPDDQKQLVRSFFKRLDGNGDGKVSIQEYSDFVKETGHSEFLSPNLFKLLDKNHDGTLDFEECVTLFYMDKKGHRLVLCDGCGSHILGIHFICVECYNVGKGTYDLCCSCYRNNNFNHVHSFFLDNYALLRAKPWEDNTSAGVASHSKRATMEELVKTARLYYNKSSSDIKESAINFFKSLDRNNHGKVRVHEFLDFMKKEGHKKMSSGYFFEELDRDKNGTLEFMEVMALYYIIKSGRPICGGCDKFIPGMYFTCFICFENGNDSFCVCPKCFEDELFCHDHVQFLDNFALLEAKRKEAIDAHLKPSSAVTITEFPTSTSEAIVPYHHKPQWDHLLYKVADKAVDLAFKALESVIDVGKTYCTIM